MRLLSLGGGRLKRFGCNPAQLAAADLAAVGGLGDRQRVERDHSARDLEGGEALAAALDRLLLVDRAAGDERDDAVVGGDHGGLLDAVLALEEGLDLARADEEA